MGNPTVVITGSGFGSTPPSVLASCGATGNDYPNNVLYLRDVTGGWNAGRTGNCTGLKLMTYTNTEIKFVFGSWYDSSPAFYVLAPGDIFTIGVDGAYTTGDMTYS
jgi:hypothetical protein